VCDAHDAVCQSDGADLLAGGNLVHTVDYQDPVIQAVTASVVYGLLFPSSAPTPGGTTGALDLAFAIDTTGSMSPYISSTVASAKAILAALDARHVDYRIGVVDYKDADGCGDYDAVTDLSFTSDRSAIQAALAGLVGKVTGGCDYPEDVLSGIDRALSLPWKNGVKKVVVQMGDAPGKDPEPHSALTLAKVAAHALAVDPAVVDPILVGPNDDAHTYDKSLAAATSGQLFDATGDPDNVGRVVAAAVGTIADTIPLQFISFPGHVFADATSASGAKVTFDTPSVSHGTATLPTVTCASKSGLNSGSLFPVGDTTVTCQANDPDTGSSASMTFTVTMRGAAAQLANLLRVVTPLPPGTSLADKVGVARTSLAAGKVPATCSTLTAFSHEVSAQSGKKLKVGLAEYLSSAAARIQQVLGC